MKEKIVFKLDNKGAILEATAEIGTEEMAMTDPIPPK